MRTNEARTMLAMVKNHMSLARMSCYVVDAETSLRRLNLPLTPSVWGIWILNHRDLRSTARVRVCNKSLTDLITEKRALIPGEASNYSN